MLDYSIVSVGSIALGMGILKIPCICLLILLSLLLLFIIWSFIQHHSVNRNPKGALQYHDDGKIALNKCVFKCRLKDDKDDDCLTVTGGLFHARGPATEKARSTAFVFVLASDGQLILPRSSRYN